jgi:hypothetical protein
MMDSERNLGPDSSPGMVSLALSVIVIGKVMAARLSSARPST